jgi:multidrug efflux pump subunit AcrA (membrane-fusion protein)
MSLDSTDARIKSGMTAETTIVTSVVDNLLRIPTRFMTKIKGISKVQVVIDSKSLKTEERDIKTARRSTDGFVEVTSGLEEGEILVLPEAITK